jgi:hypothetical protein
MPLLQSLSTLLAILFAEAKAIVWAISVKCSGVFLVDVLNDSLILCQ